MTLVRWQPMWRHRPFEGLTTLQRHMNRLFDEAFDESDNRVLTWWPRVDVTEYDDRFELKAELPGLSRDEVKVEMVENVLTVSGEKKTGTEKTERNLYVQERHFGQFRRSFQLPNRVDSSKIDASFKDGILSVTLPKVEEAKPQQIEVKVH